jgi:hypothetical protein
MLPRLLIRLKSHVERMSRMNYRTFSETRPTNKRQIIVFYMSCRRLYNHLADKRESDDD